ncbi:MAG: hypothetical protein LBQ05_03245 [Christensenellaceae bacterium]|jgi:hypothetical protein|nr:hypothetical protein [Christensenellaceae bacterium]
MKMKKFIPLGTALLSALTLISLFFDYMKVTVPILGEAGEGKVATIGDNSILSGDLDNLPDAIKTSRILYIAVLILSVIIIAIAVLNFLGIGGKNVGYAFIGTTVVTFILALIATILLFRTETIVFIETKYTPELAPWWATITSFLAMLSTGNVLLGNKKSRKKK